ncbi:15795_t:CDS:2 [Rhizophagus irregularis]|nr:15795_t:CDS:2 [Rhizophagus irregularis]
MIDKLERISLTFKNFQHKQFNFKEFYKTLQINNPVQQRSQPLIPEYDEVLWSTPITMIGPSASEYYLLSNSLIPNNNLSAQEYNHNNLYGMLEIILVEQAIKQQELIYLFVPQDELFLCKQELSEVDKRYNALFMSKRNAGWRIK